MKIKFNLSKLYIKFCKIFQTLKFPALNLKFNKNKTIHNHLILNKFEITPEEINKATTFIFLMSLIFFVLGLNLVMKISLIVSILIALLIAISVSYCFNNFLYKTLKHIEMKIEKVLPLIKIDYSILNLTLQSSFERSIYLMDTLKLYLDRDLNLTYLYTSIQEGLLPEVVLSRFITPSKRFNDFIKTITSNDFNYNYLNELESKTFDEKEFKVFLKNVDSKISIIFFIGLFFPIGLCFLILFKIFPVVFVFFLVGIYYTVMRNLFSKFFHSKVDYMTLFTGDFSNKSKKFDDIYNFFFIFSNYLGKNLSPEVSFIQTIHHVENESSLLRREFVKNRSLIVSLSKSLEDVIHYWLDRINLTKFDIILKTVKTNLERNSLKTSSVIDDILNFILKIRNYEKELELILKSENFKVYLFLLLLPIITGSLGGFFPFFMSLSEYLILQDIPLNMNYSLNLLEILIVYLNLLICNLISSNYFLKVLNIQKRIFLFLITETVYSIAFYISLFNTFLLI